MGTAGHQHGDQALKERIGELSQAFELFTAETARLEKAYASLKTKFETVNNKLEERTKALDQKVSELDAVSSYLHRILSNISQGILFIKSDGIITTYNPFAEELLNIPASDILFHSVHECFPDNLLGFSIQEALQNKCSSPPTYPKLIQDKGEERDLEVVSTYLSEEEATEGLLVLIRDLTAYHKLQMLANRSDRLKDLGEMAAAVAHEIRNPLGGIEGFASLLVRDLEEQPNLKRMASNIVSGSRTLNHLVSQVLHYARPMHIQITPYSLEELVRDTYEHVQADQSVCKLPITMTLDILSPSLVVPVDVHEMRRALMNLIFNAIQAMPEGGSLCTTIRKEKKHAIIEIQDTGEGIAPEHLEKIFSPFFTTKQKGNGFGLAEVHKVVQAHQGEIEVQSEENKGTCFTIRLPLRREGS